jgi:hypothetical protein
MTTATAYLILDKTNANFPGDITFDYNYAKSLKQTHRIHIIGTITCDRITQRDGITAITLNNKTYANGYAYLRDNNPITIDHKLGQHYTNAIKQFAKLHQH